MLGVARKVKYLRYLYNLAVNSHLQELGFDATKVIDAIDAHSKTTRTNMSVAPHPK